MAQSGRRGIEDDPYSFLAEDLCGKIGSCWPIFNLPSGSNPAPRNSGSRREQVTMMRLQQFGKYQILRKLGRSMTDVYLALDTELNRRVVLKIIEQSHDEF